MKSLSRSKPYRLGLGLLLLGLLGCEGQQSTTNLNNTFNFRSNAYMAAFQDGDGPWELVYNNNDKRDLKQYNYSLENEDGRYAVMYVCSSKFEGRNHEIYLFYLTVAEMRVSAHICRIAESKRTSYNVSGPVLKSIDGTELVNDVLNGEMAVVAFSRDTHMRAYEGYAAKLYGTDRDILAYKGPLQANNTITPQYYYRTAAQFNKVVNKFNIDFNRNTSQGTDKKVVSAAGMAPVNVTVVGKTADETLDSVFGFGSENETFLPITTSQDATFSITPAPPDFVNVGSNGDRANEGHELHVTASTPGVGGAPDLERKMASFFDQPSGDLTLTLPSLPTDNLVLKAEDNNDFRFYSVTLPQYDDPHYGTASLYEVLLSGTTAYNGPPLFQWPPDSDPATYVVYPMELEWKIYVSRGWLAASGSKEIRQPNFGNLPGWDHDWDYRKGDTAGKVTVNIYASEQPAGPLLSHLQEGEYIDGATFGKVQQSDSIIATKPKP